MQDVARLKRLAPARIDTVAAIAVFAAVELEVVLNGLGPASALVAAVASLALAFRRRAPMATMQVIVCSLVLGETLGSDWTERANAGVLLLVAASYSLGAYASRSRALAGVAVALAAMAATELFQHGSDFAFLLFIVLMPWLAGRAVRRYRERAEHLTALVEQLEGERVVRAQLAVAEERERMAAELDDALGHAVTTMVVQAGAAEQLLARSPERARAALAAVQRTGREAVTELRFILGMLRDAPERAHPAPEANGIPGAEPAPRRWLRWSASGDWAVALLMLVVGVAFALFDAAVAGVRVPVALLQVPAAAAILLRTRLPLAALMLALAAMAGESILIAGAPEAPTSLAAALLALYSVASHANRREAVLAAVLGVSVPCVLQLTVGEGDAADIVLIVSLFATPWLAGRAVRAYRRQADRLRLLTERLKGERDARVRLALVDERARIARELHDSIAHAVSVMVLQAGGAEQVAESAPERARAAARAVQDIGREALGELQQMLGILGVGQHGDGLRPRAGLAQIDALIGQVRAAGLPVRLRIRGAPVRLPASVDISAYRIIQEGLTNALKHAGPVPTTITIEYGAEALGIDIVDAGTGGRAASLAGAGRGLLGMRERVGVHGGTLTAGPRAGGGYEVRVRLALGQAPEDGIPGVRPELDRAAT